MRAVCGLDVHKDSVFLCILCETGEIIEKVFGVLTHRLHDMRRIGHSHDVTGVLQRCKKAVSRVETIW